MPTLNDPPPNQITRDWRNYWLSTFEEFEPDVLTHATPVDAVRMILHDWTLTLEHPGEVDNMYLFYAAPGEVRWTDGIWATVRLSVYDNWRDDTQEGRTWAGMDVEMREQVLREAVSGAAVFETTLDVLEWARTPTATGPHPFEERSVLAARLVDLPLPEMREVRARLTAGASGGLAEYLMRAREWVAQGEMFPVRVVNVPGQPQEEPFAPRVEYHVYVRDLSHYEDGERWTPWSPPKVAAERDYDKVVAYVNMTSGRGREYRVVRVSTEPVAIPPTP